MINVLLLRNPSIPGPDPYEDACLNASIIPHSVSVLSTSFTNLSELQHLIAAGPTDKGCSGVVLTSKRSCEAWNSAVRETLDCTRNNGDHADSLLRTSLGAWLKVPFYVVGKGTAAALKEFCDICAQHGINISLDVRGEHSGTGEQLAHFIRKDLPQLEIKQHNHTILYLTGDKNRDTVPKILSSNAEDGVSIILNSLQVYKTHAAEDLETQISLAVRKARINENSQPQRWWISFFAPSSSASVYPFLTKHFDFEHIYEPGSTKDQTNDKPIASVAAIGAVTASFLSNDLRLYVRVIADHPTPEALISAIIN